MNYQITKNLELVKTRNYKPLFKVAVVLNVFLLGYIIYLTNIDPVVKIVQTLVPYNLTEKADVELTDSALTQELIKEGSVLPSVALAQAKIESGYYTSKVCKENKNLFGIKYHKCPFVVGQNLNHAVYKTYRDNIKCYTHIQNHYLGKIDGHYAESKTYVEKIKTFKN